MGAPAQQNSAVFYDQEQGQYYTVNPPQTNDSMGNMLYGNPLSRAMFNLTGGSSNNQNRNYLGNSLMSQNNRFTPKNIPAQYPEMNMLFPALNTGLLQGIASSTQPGGAMSGAGRFLAPQTTNTQGK
jgi:hypothetical protein